MKLGIVDAVQIEALLTDYLEERCGHEELLEALTTLERDASSDLAAQLGELTTRIEMIVFNICADARRGAICELISEQLPL